MEQPTKRWNPIEIFSIFILIIAGLYLRFYHLADRPLHHDESLHGMYSLYYLENSLQNYYKYDPLLHGPLLYHITPWFFWLFGVTKYALRLPAVMVGILIMITPLFLKRWLNKSTCLILLGFIALSPTLTYWSRFIRHDYFLLLGLLIFFLGLRIKLPLVKAILVGLGIGLQFSAKENSFLHLLFLLVFFFYEPLIDHFFNLQQRTLLKRFLAFTIEHPISFLLGLGTCAATFIHYYTAGFIYWDGALDGLYRKSLVYWFEQHNTERIPGPFSFSFIINLLFEAWWLPALLIHLLTFYRRQTWIIRAGFVLALLFGGLTHFSIGDVHVKNFVSKYLKLKIPLDYYLFFPLLFHGVVAPTTYLLEKNQQKAVSAFFFFAALFTYSYVGEKVPWLAMYPLLAGLIFYSFEFDRTFHWPIVPLFLLILVHLGYTTHWTNIKNPSSPANLLSQVHTSTDFEEMLIEVRSQMESQEQGRGPYFLAKGTGTWPTTWYLHGRKEYHHLTGQRPIPSYEYILGEPNDHELRVKLQDSHIREIIPFRTWWLPDYKKMNPINLWNYFIEKKPWNSTGKQELGLWVKKPSPSETPASLSE